MKKQKFKLGQRAAHSGRRWMAPLGEEHASGMVLSGR